MSQDADIGYLKGQVDTVVKRLEGLDKKVDYCSEAMESRHQESIEKMAVRIEERFAKHHDKYTESHKLYNNVLAKVNDHEKGSAIHHEQINGKVELIESKILNIEATVENGFVKVGADIAENKKNIAKLMMIGGSLLAVANAAMEYLPQILGVK